VLTALLASCQPLPHPFADDRPPAELLAVPESAGVSIAPIAGQPDVIAAELGAATARALLGFDIPASEKSIGRGSYQLYGRLTQSTRGGKSAVAALWRLEDAKGRKIGERGVGIEATAEEWQSAAAAMVERLAALSANALAPLLVKQPAAPHLAASHLAALAEPIAGLSKSDATLPSASETKPPLPEPAAKPAIPGIAATAPLITSAKPSGPAPPVAAKSAQAKPAGKQESAPIRVAVRRVTGAPGDGDTALARAVTSVLRQTDFTLVDPGDKADFTLDGEVAIVPIGPDKQHVKIVWHVRNASGAELGNVGQENDVPRGQLSGAWGEIAYVVALAAGDGIMQVLARAAPPAAPVAPATAAAASDDPSKTGRERPPGGNPSKPAAPAAKAAKTKGKS
jgi:hypothetical protein